MLLVCYDDTILQYDDLFKNKFDSENTIYHYVNNNSDLAEKILSTYDYKLVLDDDSKIVDIDIIETYEEYYDKINNTIENLKSKKIQELNKSCNSEILSGFKSSAKDDIEKQYDFDYEAQTNMLGMQNKVLHSIILQTTVEIKWYAKDETTCVLWTNEEFMQLCEDAENFKQGRIDKYKLLKLQVLEATTKEQIESIVW
jgi:hypothetical protein